MTSRFLLFTFVVILFGCTKKKEPPPKITAIDFAKHYSITSRYDKMASMLFVDVKLDDKIHAYARNEKIGKPVDLEILPKNGWAKDGSTVIPDGKTRKLGDLGESVIIEDDFRITQKVKSGTGKGEALLHLQVCTDNICDRPRVHTLVIE